MEFEGEGAGRRHRRWGSQLASLHALSDALGGWGQLAVTVCPAPFTDDAHSEVVFVLFLQLMYVLYTDAVLLGQLPLPCLTGTCSGLLDNWIETSWPHIHHILLHLNFVHARVPVFFITWVIQCHSLPREEIKIQEGSLRAESAHGCCMSSAG